MKEYNKTKRLTVSAVGLIFVALDSYGLFVQNHPLMNYCNVAILILIGFDYYFKKQQHDLDKQHSQQVHAELDACEAENNRLLKLSQENEDQIQAVKNKLNFTNDPKQVIQLKDQLKQLEMKRTQLEVKVQELGDRIDKI